MLLVSISFDVTRYALDLDQFCQQLLPQIDNNLVKY
jgi:hypothetical protein